LIENSRRSESNKEGDTGLTVEVESITVAEQFLILYFIVYSSLPLLMQLMKVSFLHCESSND